MVEKQESILFVHVAKGVGILLVLGHVPEVEVAQVEQEPFVEHKEVLPDLQPVGP